MEKTHELCHLVNEIYADQKRCMGLGQNKPLTQTTKPRPIFKGSQEKLNSGGYSLTNHTERREQPNGFQHHRL